MNSNTEQNLQSIEKNLSEKAWWTTFLKEGAFFRENEEWCWIWHRRLNEPTTWYNKNQNISICYKHFFGDDVFYFNSDLQATRVPTLSLKRALSRQIEAAGVDSQAVLKKSDFTGSAKESFEKGLREIFLKINRGEIDKAVPVTFTRSTKIPTTRDLMKWMTGALCSPANLWAYGFWTDGEAGFNGIIGTTPEILFDLTEGKLLTMALAGTLPKSEVEKRGSLLKDPKERHEHDLVVQDLKVQLSKYGGVNCRETEVVELPTLFHLRTFLEVNFNTGDFSEVAGRKKKVEDLLLLLHPTPALGVSPRRYGYQWMKELPDQVERKKHGAPICFLLPHRTLCLVAIRNIQWDQNGTQIGAGCGIVKESQLDREWTELGQKINSVFQILGIE